jgi:hypothetical protein
MANHTEMTNLQHILNRYATGKIVLALFILTNLVYAFMLLVTIPQLMVFAGGLKTLDMLPAGYDLEYIHLLMNSLGETGRQFYLNRQLPADTIYPALFGIGYCLLMAYLLNKRKLLRTPYHYLCLLPILAALADYAENLSILSMLRNYPNISDSTAQLSSIFSVIKSSSTTVYFVALLMVLVGWGIKLLTRKK